MSSNDREALLANYVNEALKQGGLNPDDSKDLELVLQEPSLELLIQTGLGEESSETAQSSEEDSKNNEDIRFQLTEMSVPAKIKLALFGNSTCRMLLIADANKVVSLAVLKNPKLTPGEVEEIAKNSNVSDQILRNISTNSKWTKEYKVKLNLVLNPKTPSDLALRWLRHLNSFDLKRVARSKNIPQVIATTARKLTSEKQK